MKYTGNYNLKKPEGADTVNIEDFNDNADIVDQQLKANADAAAAKETPSGAQAKVNAHENKKTNPHAVTKAQVGLGDVDNAKQATKVEFDEHLAEKASHGVYEDLVTGIDYKFGIEDGLLYIEKVVG